MKTKEYPSKNTILEHLDYSREEGCFYYKPKIGSDRLTKSYNTRFAGKTAQRKEERKNGVLYYTTSLCGESYRTARLVWIVEYGSISKNKQVDHIDGNPLNNHITNLRLVSNHQNSKNMTKRTDNKSGHPGVFLLGSGKWVAYIRHNYKRYHLGRYEKLGDAIEARKNAEIEFGFHCNHGKEPNYIKRTIQTP